MHKVFEANIETFRLKLSRSSVQALKHIDNFDWLLFTSKHAVEYFMLEIRERKLH